MKAIFTEELREITRSYLIASKYNLNDDNKNLLPSMKQIFELSSEELEDYFLRDILCFMTVDDFIMDYKPFEDKKTYLYLKGLMGAK